MHKYFKILALLIIVMSLPIYIYTTYNRELSKEELIDNFMENKILYIHGDINVEYNDKYEKDFLLNKILKEQIDDSKIFGKLEYNNDQYKALLNLYSKYKKNDFDRTFKIDENLKNKIIEESIYDKKNNMYIFKTENNKVDKFESNFNISMQKNENKITKANIEISGKYNRKLNMDISYIVKIEIEP